MSKSLAERIGEHTREEMKDREERKRKAQKPIVFEILKKMIREKAQKGKELFNDSKTALSITVGEIQRQLETTESAKMKVDEVENVLKDIGFEINCDSVSKTLGIPQENVSKEIQELLKMYNELLNAFESAEKSKAEEDCEVVLAKLDNGEYKVKGINRVTINFSSSSNSEQYLTYVREMMREQGFTVDISLIKWDISIIQEDGG